MEEPGSAEHSGHLLLLLSFPDAAFHPGLVSFPPADFLAKGGLALLLGCLGLLSGGLGAPVVAFSWSLLWVGINTQTINKWLGFRPF